MSTRTTRTVVALVAAVATSGALVGTASAGHAAPAASRAAAVAVAKDHGKTDFGFAASTFTKGGTRYVRFDRAVMFTGQRARAAKAAHGLDPDDAPDFYIQNDNPKLRTYALSPSVKVYGSQVLTGSPAHRPVPLRSFLRLVSQRKGTAYPPFTLTFRGGKVVRITEKYLA